MAFSERSLDDYVDVAERIAEFYDRYPDGSLQPADPSEPWSMSSVQGFDKSGDVVQQTFIVYVAAAYRTPDDARPGIGVAWEIFPGRTPYTRGSEVMNAETSAWGRAIAALGIATKKGIASRQEVANRRHERDDGLPTNADGSLSRSRTTDAEKEMAGVMTTAQQAEHTALRKGADQGRVLGVVRCSLAEPCHQPDCARCYPEQSAWDAGTPEHQPGTIGPAQRRKIMTHLGRMKQPERAAKLTELAGRAVSSTNDLSFTEAAAVLAKLEGK